MIRQAKRMRRPYGATPEARNAQEAQQIIERARRIVEERLKSNPQLRAKLRAIK